MEEKHAGSAEKEWRRIAKHIHVTSESVDHAIWSYFLICNCQKLSLLKIRPNRSVTVHIALAQGLGATAGLGRGGPYV